MRTSLYHIAVGLALMLSPARAQDTQPATSSPSEGPKPSFYEEMSEAMTLEEVIKKAYENIELAEKKGEGAGDALKKVDSMLGLIRAKDPLNADGDFLAGRMHLILKRPREAIQYIDRYSKSKKGSNDWLAYKFLGNLLLEGKYYSMANDKYRRATELSPSEPAPHGGLAKTELEQGRPVVAEGHARKAVELDAIKPPAERDPTFSAVLAQALLGQNKLDEAAKAATDAEEIGRIQAMNNPEDAMLLNKLNEFQGLRERVIGAILKTYPERKDEYVRLARVLRERADVARLIKYHNILLTVQFGIDRTAPDTPSELILEQARLLTDIGNFAKARTVLQELLAKEPENAEASRLLGGLPEVVPPPAK